MPYFESIPACWALPVSTLSGSSLLAWLAWSSLPWLRSSCRIWSLSIFICGLLSISSMCPERLAGPASAGSRQRTVPALRGLAGGAGGADVGVVDLLLADGLADLVVLGDGLGAEPDPLHRDGLLVHDGLLSVQGDLVLFLADVAARHRGTAVGVGDRLALETDFLVADRDGLGGGL